MIFSTKELDLLFKVTGNHPGCLWLCLFNMLHYIFHQWTWPTFQGYEQPSCMFYDNVFSIYISSMNLTYISRSQATTLDFYFWFISVQPYMVPCSKFRRSCITTQSWMWAIYQWHWPKSKGHKQLYCLFSFIDDNHSIIWDVIFQNVQADALPKGHGRDYSAIALIYISMSRASILITFNHSIYLFKKLHAIAAQEDLGGWAFIGHCDLFSRSHCQFLFLFMVKISSSIKDLLSKYTG